MLSIQTNYASLSAQENLRVNTDFQVKTIGRVTSGFRINSSGDDAAGLVVANQYRSQVAELTQGVRNANDGVSTLQIIDGGLNNISKMLDRLKTLATESATDTFTGDRATLNAEFQDLMLEIDRQADNINLGQNNGTLAANLQVYIGGNVPKVSIDLSSVVYTQGGVAQAAAPGNVDSASLLLGGDILNQTSAGTAIDAIDDAVANLGVVQGVVGTGQNKLATAINLAQSQIANFSAAESRIRDADMASEAANLTKAQVLQQASLAAMAQANTAPQAVLSLLKG
jgi:flagellin